MAASRARQARTAGRPSGDQARARGDVGTPANSLRVVGIRIRGTGRTGFDAAVREAVADDALTSELMDAMLAARAMLWKQYRRLHDLVVKFVARHELCRRFMAIPVWVR
jgi:transposase